MKIGDLIHSRRTELGLTLEEVGKAVGVEKSTVKKWESGYISNMRRDKIALLANVLQISPVSLVVEDEDVVFSNSVDEEPTYLLASRSTDNREVQELSKKEYEALKNLISNLRQNDNDDL